MIISYTAKSLRSATSITVALDSGAANVERPAQQHEATPCFRKMIALSNSGKPRAVHKKPVRRTPGAKPKIAKVSQVAVEFDGTEIGRLGAKQQCFHGTLAEQKFFRELCIGATCRSLATKGSRGGTGRTLKMTSFFGYRSKKSWQSFHREKPDRDGRNIRWRFDPSVGSGGYSPLRLLP